MNRGRGRARFDAGSAHVHRRDHRVELAHLVRVRARARARVRVRARARVSSARTKTPSPNPIAEDSLPRVVMEDDAAPLAAQCSQDLRLERDPRSLVRWRVERYHLDRDVRVAVRARVSPNPNPNPSTSSTPNPYPNPTTFILNLTPTLPP